MVALEGELSSESALAILRRLALERLTGRLELRQDERTETLFFVSGDLYLEPDHPLALALGSTVLGPTIIPSAQEANGGKPKSVWFSQAVDELQSWTAGHYSFTEDPTGISTDLVGPLPALGVVMEAAVHESDEFQLLRRLGGDDARYAVPAQTRSLAADSVELDPVEAFLLSRMDRPISVKELVRQSDLDRLATLKGLCRLLAVDLICPEEKLPRAQQRALLDSSLLEKFSSRIAASLERQPLEIEADAHRRQIADLLGRLGTITYYELLGVGAGATTEEIHVAYSDLARTVHPRHAKRLGLAGKEGGMQLVFEKATEAYLTLSDRDRSRKYLLEIGSPGDVAAAKGGMGEERQDEVVEMAEHNFRMAKAMVLREDYHFAVELLQQAVRALPKAEYYALLGRCQARNPRWLQKAVASYGRAVQLAPDDFDVRIELARILESAGDRVRARREYEAILNRLPGHPEATAGLQRLRDAGAAAGGEGSWWHRLLKGEWRLR